MPVRKVGWINLSNDVNKTTNAEPINRKKDTPNDGALNDPIERKMSVEQLLNLRNILSPILNRWSFDILCPERQSRQRIALKIKMYIELSAYRRCNCSSCSSSDDVRERDEIQFKVKVYRASAQAVQNLDTNQNEKKTHTI